MQLIHVIEEKEHIVSNKRTYGNTVHIAIDTKIHIA